MASTRSTIYIAAAILFATMVLSKEGDHKIHIKGIQCNHSQKFLFDSMTCFARSYSRTFCGMNIAAFAKRPLYDIQVKISFLMYVAKFIFNNFR